MVTAPKPDDSDAELVARMARGDHDALAALYQRHSPRLRALALRILQDEMASDDVLHDVFLEAWRRSADYSPERGSVSAWLSMRVRSRAIDRRRARPRSVSPVPDTPSPESAPDAGRSVDHARLRDALSSMSEAERSVILLGYFEGLTSSEIALESGLSIGTVKSRTRSALNKLRRFFDPEGSRT